MGGAKFMGREVSSITSKSQNAFNHLFYWGVGGWAVSFGLAVAFIKPNFLIPIGFYLLVWILLFCRFLYYDNKEVKKKKKKK